MFPVDHQYHCRTVMHHLCLYMYCHHRFDGPHFHFVHLCGLCCCSSNLAACISVLVFTSRSLSSDSSPSSASNSAISSGSGRYVSSASSSPQSCPSHSPHQTVPSEQWLALYLALFACSCSICFVPRSTIWALLLLDIQQRTMCECSFLAESHGKEVTASSV